MRRNPLKLSMRPLAIIPWAITPLAITLTLASLAAEFVFAANATELVEEIVVWGAQSTHRAATSHPSSILTQQDLVSINVATTEDVVKLSPAW